MVESWLFAFLVGAIRIAVMTQVTLVTGSAGAGKTRRLLDDYRDALEQARLERRPNSVLWLTPTRRIQRWVTQQLLARFGKACFVPNVLTFDRFAEGILEAAGRPASPMSPVMKRLLLRRIAAEFLNDGELQHFRSIAGTTGFLDVVSNFISELKREEIWPDKFVQACKERRSAFARRDLELGLIYERYQQLLEQQNWYDNEGRFWLARDLLGKGQREPFEDVRFLAVDGFADFTQTQYEILGFLAQWIDKVEISLPVETPLVRTDLFSKSDAAINRIKKHLRDGTKWQIDRLSTDDSAKSVSKAASAVRQSWCPAVRVVADRLFSNPRFGEVSSDADGLEIIAATGQNGEWESVALRIKQMLSANPISTNRVKPQEIVIGMRSLADDGPRLRDYLASAGLPVWCEAESPLNASPVVKMVLNLLQLELDDWPFERLMHVLDSTFFQPNWPEYAGGRAVRAAASVMRNLSLFRERELILRVVNRYAKDSISDDSRLDSLNKQARLAAPLLHRLSRTFDRLRRSHTLNDWADVLATITDELDFAPTGSSTSEATPESDIDLLQRILRTAAEADQKISGESRPRSFPLTEFASEFRDLLSHETIDAPPEPGGVIRILSVEQIRNLDVPYLFLLGLTENSFPMNRTDDCLFSEAERQDFNERGVPLKHRSSHHVDEMSLFYSVVTRARRGLTLCFPEVNSKGQPVFASPYVSALTSLFAPQSVKRSHEGQLDPVPSVDRTLTATDLRLSAMDLAIQGKPGLYRAVMELDPLRKASWNSLAACDVADHRFHQHGFTTYEGNLSNPQNRLLLGQRFSSYHQFSATELESYARCPFQFWLSNVLKVGAVESPEEGTDFAGRGTMLHEVLARLLVEGMSSDPKELSLRFRELIVELLKRNFPETDLQQALIDAEREILYRWADAFGEQHSDYQQQVDNVLKDRSSLDPEIAFGRLPDAPETSTKVHPPIRFGSTERFVDVRGRIDRIDIGKSEGRPAFVVVDYKSGMRPSTKEDDFTSGRSIQLALYLLAVKRLGLVGTDAVPFQMGYWALKETGFKPEFTRAKFVTISPDKIQWLEQVMENLLPQLADEIREGRFIVENADQHCTGRCVYRTVCRVNQIRPLAEQLGKQSATRPDPSLTTTKEELDPRSI